MTQMTRMAKIDLTDFHNDYHAPELFRQRKTYTNSKMLFAFLNLFCRTKQLRICLRWMLAAGSSCTAKAKEVFSYLPY